MDKIALFLFETAMLKKTPRSGWQFLGTGKESVAEHSFGATMIAFVLARLSDNVDTDHVIRMALVHDLAEARTGDLNYMNQKYVTVDERRAADDMLKDLPFADEIHQLLDEYNLRETPEAQLVYDADQLELLVGLKEQLDLGNQGARDWLPFLLKRLKSDTAQRLAERILHTNSSDWWFDQGSSWWIRGGKDVHQRAAMSWCHIVYSMI